MLAIRLQRTGRKGHAQFRIIVQDAHRSPSSGNVVMRLGNYDPHTKAITVDKEKSAFYLEHGAQPSPRVAYLLQKEGVKLPSWVTIEKDRQRAIKNTEKLRRNRTEEEKPAEAEAPQADEPTQDVPAEEPEAPTGETKDAPAEDAVAEVEAPAEEASVAEETAANEVAVETTEADVVADAEAADESPAKAADEKA